MNFRARHHVPDACRDCPDAEHVHRPDQAGRRWLIGIAVTILLAILGAVASVNLRLGDLSARMANVEKSVDRINSIIDRAVHLEDRHASIGHLQSHP